MYEIHQPAWMGDSHVGNTDTLKAAKVMTYEYGPAAEVWKTYGFRLFGWHVRFTMMVWRGA